MKTILLVLFCWCSSSYYCSLKGQIIHHTLEISKNLKSTGFDTVYRVTNQAAANRILSLLNHNAPKLKAGMDTIDYYKANPFIRPIITSIEDSIHTGQDDASIVGGENSGDRSSGLFGNVALSESTILLGLTDFLVQRTKEELNIAFFQEFQTVISNNEEMRYLFPATKEVLLQIGTEVYQFNAYWEDMREAFLKDLDDLIYNLDDYVQESSHIKDELARDVISDLFKLVEMLYNQKSPSQIVEYLGTDAYLQTLTEAHLVPDEGDTLSTKDRDRLQNIQNSLKLLAIISKSLHSKIDPSYWVDQDKLVEVIRNPIAMRVYLGLLYEQVRGDSTLVLFNKTAQTHLNKFADAINSATSIADKRLVHVYDWLNQIKLFLRQGERIKRLSEEIQKYDGIRRRSKTKPTTEDLIAEHQRYHDFAQQTMDLLLYVDGFCDQLVDLSDDTTHKKEYDTIRTKIYTYLTIAKDLNTIVLKIRTQDYAPVINHTISMIEKILPKDSCYNNTRAELLRYGSFIATAVAAKTPKEVTDAIAAFALPPGSAALKKQAHFSIMIQAYVGLSTGIGLNDGRFYTAVTTPVGVNFSTSLDSEKKKNSLGAIALFVPLIDLGAVSELRFVNQDTAVFPALNIVNVFSPGLYAVWSVPKYPVALGIGAQYSPRLTRLTNNEATLDPTAWRLGAFMTVDIPLLKIHSTAPKQKKNRCQKDR